MFTPTGNCDGQITECKVHKIIIYTCVFQVNKQLYFQFHYSYSVDSLVNMASKMRKVGKSSRKVVEDFGVGRT